ncbi:hypothetical protein PEPTYR26121_00222 [Peptoniphilus tyrrelliae]|nr:hypothetical protein PEPTYR26121_00222 [Peptoniphilus tyrrelliae]
MEKLRLYVGTTCPFCKKVESFMEDNGIDSVEIKNIDEDKDAREYLIEKGGKKQVPCLFIGDKALYESLDIIKYLKDNLA